MKFISRLLLVILSVWILARGAIYLLPGDPVDYLVNESLIQTSNEKTISDIHKRMDLNISFWQRISSLPRSESLINGEPTLPIIKKALLNSTILASLTLVLTLSFSLLLLYLGYQSKNWSRFGHTLSIFLASIPIFISGPILLFLFSLKLNIFPVTRQPLLPAICLAFYLTGFWYRSISQKILNYLPQSAVPGARARGLSELRIFIFYVLAPCAGSLVRFFSAQMGNLLNGSLIVEIVFQWPGLGFLLSDAIMKRDYPVIEVCLITVSLVTLLSLQVGKWLQFKLEPKQC